MLKVNHIVLAASVLIFSTAASARPSHENYFVEQLGLSEEQATAVKELRQEKRSTMKDSREEREQVKTLIEAGDTEAAAELAAELAKKHVYSKAEFRSKLSTILTTEQMEAFDAMPKKRRGKHGEGKRFRSNSECEPQE